MKGISLETILKGKGFIVELMEGSILEDEKLIKCTEKDFLLGLMEGGMKVIIWTTKKKGLGLFCGRMEENMKGIGRMGNNMEKGFILVRILVKRGNGKMAKELNG